VWFGRRRPIGDARGKSRRLPWSADFSGQWCAAGDPYIVRRALRRISTK
jgi:hypothetical protein